MAVPEYIRMVPRPVNTIVEDNGRDGPNRFAVRERVSIKYISGGNPQPKKRKGDRPYPGREICPQTG